MNESKIIIIGAMRNNEVYLNNVLNNIISIGKLFKDYKVIIYENDSMDNTKNMLKRYVNENNKIEVRSESNLDKKYKYRTERLAYIRNKLLNYVLEKYRNYDYLLNMDMDDVNSTTDIVDTFHNIFTYNNEIWDIQTIHQRKSYYDIWAYRKTGLIEYDCWYRIRKEVAHGMPYEVSYENNVTKFQKPYTLINGLIPVISAFGGAAIYKIPKLLEARSDAKYIGLNKYGEICEHVSFHETLKNNYNAKIFINPLWINKD